VLSFGGGQDSTAILHALENKKRLRKQYAPGHLLVLMSDTGDEHPRTYLHLKHIEKVCEAMDDTEFVLLTPDMGFHARTWQSLRSQYALNNTCGSKAFHKTCTVNLKINPIYHYLNWYVSQRFGHHQYGSYRLYDKTYSSHFALYTHSQEYGKIRVLIGIAKDEEVRVDDGPSAQMWMNLSIVRQYPLLALGWNRLACQKYIRSTGNPVPPPSNCMLCPFMDRRELLLLARKYPKDFRAWVVYERNKLKKFADKGDRNVGVFGNLKTLEEILAEAEAEFGHMTLDELEEHRFSHGHCVKSKY